MIRFFTALLFILAAAILTSGCNSEVDKRFDNQKSSLDKNIGQKFELTNILDSTGSKIKLDFTTSEYTIIDFWNNSCPPCIEEMRQFPALLKGKERKISIVSISVNQFWLWKPTIAVPSGQFSFLNNTTRNWSHYTLESNQDARLKNEFSTDRIAELGIKYNITYFPAYFVVNRKGIIQSREISAVDFLKQLN